MARVTPPPVSVLLKILENTDIKIVERARVTCHRKDGSEYLRSVSGYCDPDTPGSPIVVSRLYHRETGANEAISTVIHELLHLATAGKVSERWVRRHELAYFKDPQLREAVAVKLLNVALFDR